MEHPQSPQPSAAPPSLQDRYYPDLRCFGCGPSNTEGLRLRSFDAGDGVSRAEFTPRPHHDNGLGYLNGGIIATILDCHSAAAVTHEAYVRGWPPIAGTPLPYVTAGLDVRYLRPAPLDHPITVLARIVEASEQEIKAGVWLEWDGKERSRAVARWRRWNPR